MLWPIGEKAIAVDFKSRRAIVVLITFITQKLGLKPRPYRTALIASVKIVELVYL